MSGQQVIGASPGEVSSTPISGLGDETVSNNNRYHYFKATGTLTKGQLIAIDSNNEASAGAVTSALVNTAGIVMANMTTGQYGWAFRMGPSCNVLAASTTALGVPLHTTGTAGVVASPATAGVIRNLRLNATVGGVQALTACSAGAYITIN